MRKSKKAGMRFIVILIVGLAIISLAGCIGSQMPPKPTKPMIDILPREGGGMCLDRENTIRLGDYILQLESGYE